MHLGPLSSLLLQVTEGLEEATIIALAAGDCQTIALDISGKVYGWGCYKDKVRRRLPFTIKSDGRCRRKHVHICCSPQVGKGSHFFHVRSRKQKATCSQSGCRMGWSSACKEGSARPPYTPAGRQAGRHVTNRGAAIRAGTRRQAGRWTRNVVAS